MTYEDFPAFDFDAGVVIQIVELAVLELAEDLVRWDISDRFYFFDRKVAPLDRVTRAVY